MSNKRLRKKRQNKIAPPPPNSLIPKKSEAKSLSPKIGAMPLGSKKPVSTPSVAQPPIGSLKLAEIKKEKRVKGLSKSQMKVINEANMRLRNLEKMGLARASPAAEAVINRISDIYGNKRPKEVKFMVKNLSPIKQKQMVAEARKFLKMATSTVEGTQEALKRRDEALMEHFELDKSSLKSYYDIAELFSSDIKTYSLTSDVIYSTISIFSDITDFNTDYMKVALEIAIKAAKETNTTKADIAHLLSSETTLLSEYFSYSYDMEDEDDVSYLKNLFSGSLTEKVYGKDIKTVVDELNNLLSHVDDRRKAREEEKQDTEFRLHW